jgi:hypothetical protein
MHRHHHFLVAIFTFAALCHFVHAAPNYLLTRDGVAQNIPGYDGTTYQAIRFEPFCGTLGADGKFVVPLFNSDNCGPSVMNAYTNSTDHFALYDATGVRLEGAIVGPSVF